MKKNGLLFSLILCTLLSACGGKDDSADSALAYYTFEGDTIPSIEQFINAETGGRLVATLSPTVSEESGGQDNSEETGEQDEAAETDTQSETNTTEDTASAAEEQNYLSYDYQQFTEGQPASIAASYVSLLEGDDIALHLESEDEPTFDSNTGSVTLIRQAVATDSSGAPQKKETASTTDETATASDEGGEGDGAGESDSGDEATLLPYSDYEQDTQMRFRVRIDWTPTSCLITLDKTAGQDFVTSLQEAGTFLSFSGAKALMNTVTPAEIGLPGKSMSEYSLKPGPGFVMVDGQACLTVYVYGKNSVGTNSLMGTYFISSDCSTLYHQMGETSDEVEKIEFPSDIPTDLPTEGETAVKTEPTP